jgi:acetate kinase
VGATVVLTDAIAENMKVLLLNAGSSSLKATVVESSSGSTSASGLADWAGSATHYHYAAADGAEVRSDTLPLKGHADAVKRFLSDLAHREPVQLPNPSDLAAVGHRIVHGGRFASSIRITPDIRAEIVALADLAPLHNPPSLAALAAAETELHGVPQVAVFDTSFHSTMPPEAWVYPLPEQWTRDWGIRRYGFHGLSHDYCSRRAAELLGRPADRLRLVICHLGNGCSAAAVVGGRSVDTTMGFTPLEGLMMGTRCGSIDPSIPLYVQQHHGLSAEEVEAALNHQSGLLGVSSVSSDMRAVLEAARSSQKRAQTALAVYAHRVRQAIGALAVTMGGVDALVFTAGVGEHAAEVRETVCEGLGCLGLELDAKANADCHADADVATAGSRGRILVMATREDVTMLREVLKVLGKQDSTAKSVASAK